MLTLFPGGFEEAAVRGGVQVAVYTDDDGERRLRDAFGDVAVEPIAPGWQDAWKRFHRPVRVGPLWVGPPWATPDAGAIPVVIDPGRAFGTGAHPTTRLCLELLLAVDRGSLVDLGCGSGVLAIAAAKLGFHPATALDVDEVAVETARANARANGVEAEVVRSDVIAEGTPAADVAVANIEREAVERVAARVSARSFLTSGYLAGERPALAGWTHAERREAGGWAADRFDAPEPGSEEAFRRRPGRPARASF